MIKNTLLILYRNQEKQKLVSLINIIGLAIALSCLILTIVFLKNELSYDRWNPNINKLYRLTRSYWSLDGSRSMHLGHISAPFAPFLMGSLPEIEKIGRIVQYETLLSADGPDRQNWLEKSVYMVDPEILELFSISFIAGNIQKALNEPFKII
jgi:putative ABC transport system permease protein